MTVTRVFTKVEQLTPEWLTACLRSDGTLKQGRVLSIAGHTEPTLVSSFGRITVRYSADSPSSAPPSLFLKTNPSGDIDNDDWQTEVRFYQALAPELKAQTARCYAAAYAADPARFHLLLEDLSDTHERCAWPLPPTPHQLEQAVDCLASIHAHWWDHPRFRRDIQPRFTETSLSTWLAVWEKQLAQYLDFLGDRLVARRRAIYQRALPQMLALLLKRRQTGQNCTLAHQDAHPYNFLYPWQAAHTTRLVDWSTWDVELGARDLAYLIALHLFPEHRALVEKQLLRRYHEQLISAGVQSYSWDQLWDDHRLSAIWNLFIPVEQFFWHIPARVWWWHTERSFLAFDDLACAELLT
jgi:thiamine kinase-like enzyme